MARGMALWQTGWLSLAPLRRWLRSRLGILLVIVTLAAIGYRLGPADMPVGEYVAQVAVRVNGTTLDADYPFALGAQSGPEVTVTTRREGYRLVVTGPTALPYELGAQLLYRVRLLDESGHPVPLALEQVTSTLTGPGYTQLLPPTGREGEGLRFSMRVPYRAKIVFALLFAVAGLWVTEVVPLAAGAMLVPVVAVLTGVTDAETVTRPFAHPIIMLFLAGFLLAQGMHRTGVDRLLALAILRHASPKPAFLMLTMMVLPAFLAMWMSNTASVSLVIPIALAVLAKLPAGEATEKFRRALILGVAYGAAVGGIGSALGSPPNILALAFLNEYTEYQMSFVDWFKFGLPMVGVMLPIVWLYLLRSFGLGLRQPGLTMDRAIYAEEWQRLGGLQPAQRTMLGVFGLVAALWLTETWHHVPTGIVALGGAFALFLLGILREEDFSRLNWNALLTFGGSLAIGTLLVSSGVSDWIALHLLGLSALPSPLVVLLLASLTVVTGAFISNTACAAMLIPLVIPLAPILNMDPRLLVAIVAIGSSIDFALVIGTPPTMIAYSTGFFTTRDIFKRGIALDLISVLVLSFVVVWLWQALGVVGIP